MLRAAVEQAQATAARIMMCRPTYFQVSYSINPWMNVNRKVDRKKALQQWDALKVAIEEAGGTVEVMEANGAENYPDLVFTANSAVVRGNRALISNFRCPERQGEHLFYRKWFEEKGYKTLFNPNIPFEGAGDALWAGAQKLFCGVGPRTDPRALKLLVESFADEEQGPLKVIGCRLVDQRFYHIDTCFCPLNEHLAFYYPEAFDIVSNHNMGNDIELVPVPMDDAMKFACNAVVIKDTVIMNKGCENTAKILEKLGFRTHFVDMSEFIKSGGSAKCCTILLPTNN